MISKFKRTILFILSFIIYHLSFSQQVWYPESFIQTQGRLNKDGAIGLCSWSFGNAVFSGYQLSATAGQEQNFHKMNLVFSGLELVRGIPLFVRSYKIYKGKVTLKLDTYNPKKYLKNYSLFSWIDLAYIGTGIILHSRAANSADPELARGIGNGFLLQGSFLFTFDSVMYLLHRKLLKNHIRNQTIN